VELPPKFKTVEAWADSLYDEVRLDQLLLVVLPTCLCACFAACWRRFPETPHIAQCLLVW